MVRRHIPAEKNELPGIKIRNFFGKNSQYFDDWKTIDSKRDPDIRSYISLVALAHVIRLLETQPPDKHKFKEILSGAWFSNHRIENFPLLPELRRYEESELSRLTRLWWPYLHLEGSGDPGDLFGDLHHDLISPVERHKTGTQYTPSWLADGIVDQLLSTNPEGRLLDPACGSGIFLVRALGWLKKDNSSISPVQHLEQLKGIDRDPLAIGLAAANLLISLGRELILDANSTIEIPLSVGNVLNELEEDRNRDLIVGNPPWITYRSLSPVEQNQIMILSEKAGLGTQVGHLISHIELASIFSLISAYLFATSNARLGMIMPRSVLVADHHTYFRELLLGSADNDLGIALESLWDLEKVNGLFSVASCVVYLKMNVHSCPEKIPAMRIMGASPASLDWSEARNNLNLEQVEFSSSRYGNRLILKEVTSSDTDNSTKSADHYRSQFRQGATLVPRSFWFVESAGNDGHLRKLKSKGTGKRGPTTAYSSVTITGAVEEQFLYVTTLGDDLIPFGIRSWRLVVLPLLENHCLNSKEADDLGYRGLAKWLRAADKHWHRIRKDKAHRLSIVDRLNYRRDLVSQNLDAEFTVIYPNLQRIPCTLVVARNDILNTANHSLGIRPKGFVVDTAAYYFRTNDLSEADYLAAMLNAPLVNQLLEPLRNRSQRNQPNVHKRIFDVASIPEYNPESRMHIELSGLGAACRNKISDWVRQDRQICSKALSKCRDEARNMLKKELSLIDEIAREILHQ